MPDLPPLSEVEIQSVLAELRTGATLAVGGSRCHSVLGYGSEGWYWEDFDEGRVETRAASEEDVRELAGRDPKPLVAVLQAMHWRALAAAWLEARPEQARGHLANWRRYGDRWDWACILQVVLAWPQQAPTAVELEAIRNRIADQTVFQLWMALVDWRMDADTARAGLGFVDQLIAICGECSSGAQALRTQFLSRL